jgi:hypothetical protein
VYIRSFFAQSLSGPSAAVDDEDDVAEEAEAANDEKNEGQNNHGHN